MIPRNNRVAEERRKRRRTRRRKQRGRMQPAEATELSSRSRQAFPATKTRTRFHRQLWYFDKKETRYGHRKTH